MMKITERETNPFKNSDTNKRYYTYDYYLKRKYGMKIFKAPIDAGFTCPNIDGKCGYGGCTYCSGRGSGDFAPPSYLSVREQYEKSAEMMRKKWPQSRGIVYFQAHTNTYAPIERLRALYEEALSIRDAVGVSIATRADCLEDETVALLKELSERTDLTVELGLQTVWDKTAERINRGHDYKTFLEGYEKLRSNGIDVCIHIINGLPGEDFDMMMDTARAVASLRPTAVKIHLLHVIKGTVLAEEYKRGELSPLTREAYVKTVVSQLEIMPADTVIGRVTGDGAPDTLLAPEWSKKKLTVMNEIDKEFVKRGTYQGIFEHSQ